ncbi:TolB family protein [Kineococcus aurantiacus]|uniref:Tol biopolymer transport system component n=1 Tax=Kineococcus aurantiacus TaxID=37633 RepID=A0A7Y9DM88_9ACTN|nr:hypothetical protein [Kineococcus aurantiacus]NYD23114.1 Tol biopolymer transport system component [Kineococcus aurantiacus]
MRTVVGTLGVAALVAGLVGGAVPAAAAPVAGPVVAYSGFSAGRVDGLYAVDTGTGRQWHVADGLSTDVSWSPTGEQLAWISYGADDLGHVQVARADGGDRRQVDGDGDSRALAWSPDGTLGWFHRTAWAPTDCSAADRLVRPDFVLRAPDGTRRTLGTVAPTARDLGFSPDGTTAVWRESGADVCGGGVDVLVAADVATGRRGVVTGAEGTSGLSFSPDGTSVVLTRPSADGGDVVLVDLPTRTARPVPTADAGEASAVFVGDGAQLVVVRTTAAGRRLVVVDRGGAVVRDLAEAPGHVEQLLASSDRSSVVVAGRSLPAADGTWQDTRLWRQPLDGSPATPLSGNATAGVFEAAVAPWTSAAPALQRRSRTRG